MSTENIDLSQVRWEDASMDEDKPGRRLLSSLQFNGISHHLEAIEVEYDENASTQSAVCLLCDDILTTYREATGADGPFSTVTIDQRTYVIFVTPYCS